MNRVCVDWDILLRYVSVISEHSNCNGSSGTMYVQRGETAGSFPLLGVDDDASLASLF